VRALDRGDSLEPTQLFLLVFLLNCEDSFYSHSQKQLQEHVSHVVQTRSLIRLVLDPIVETSNTLTLNATLRRVNLTSPQTTKLVTKLSM
jgi:hypothetical protein